MIFNELISKKYKLLKWAYKHPPYPIYDKASSFFYGYFPEEKKKEIYNAIRTEAPRKISVIIATRNKFEALKKYALKSLDKIRFNKCEYEIVVVDNGDGDKVKGYIDGLQDKRFKAVKELYQGVCFARNRGVKESTGDVVVFIDDDSYVDVNWLDRLYSFYSSDEKYLIGQGLRYDVIYKRITTQRSKPSNLVEYNFSGANISFRKDLFKYVSFSNSIKYGADEYDVVSQIISILPEVKYFTDMVSSKHFRESHEYRNKNEAKLHKKGKRYETKMYRFWNIHRNTIMRNIDIDKKLFKLRFFLTDLLFFAPELVLIKFDIRLLHKIKKQTCRQIKKLQSINKI